MNNKQTLLITSKNKSFMYYSLGIICLPKVLLAAGASGCWSWEVSNALTGGHKKVVSWRLYLTGSVPSSLDGIGLTGLSWFSQEWFAAREQACALRQSAGTDVTDSHVLPATCQDVLPPEDDACAVPSSIQNCELKHFFFYTEGVITTPNRQVTSSYMQWNCEEAFQILISLNCKLNGNIRIWRGKRHNIKQFNTNFVKWSSCIEQYTYTHIYLLLRISFDRKILFSSTFSVSSHLFSLKTIHKIKIISNQLQNIKRVLKWVLK